MNDFINALIVSFVFILIFAVSEIMSKKGIKSEVTRKFSHFSGAIVSLIFPFIFQSYITVLSLCIIFCLFMLISKKFDLMKSIHNIDRNTDGAVYHPIAILTCFVYAQILNQPWFYVISILILAISDAAAALVGKTYGHISYTVDTGSKKTLEGSLIFFFTSFLIVHIVLLLATHTGRLESVLIALLIALIVTLFESLSLRGCDNFFVPIASMVILSKNVSTSPDLIFKHVCVLIGIILIFCLIMRPYKKIGFSGVLLLGIFQYILWALGGIEWVLALFIASVFCQKTRLFLIENTEKYEQYRVVTVFYILIFPVVSVIFKDYLYNTGHYDMASLFFVPYITLLTAWITILRGWKKRLESEVKVINIYSILRNIAVILILIPVFLCFKYSPYYLILSILMIFVTNKLYWLFVNKNPENSLITGFKVTSAMWLIITLLTTGVHYVFHI